MMDPAMTEELVVLADVAATKQLLENMEMPATEGEDEDQRRHRLIEDYFSTRDRLISQALLKAPPPHADESSLRGFGDDFLAVADVYPAAAVANDATRDHRDQPADAPLLFEFDYAPYMEGVEAYWTGDEDDDMDDFVQQLEGGATGADYQYQAVAANDVARDHHHQAADEADSHLPLLEFDYAPYMEAVGACTDDEDDDMADFIEQLEASIAAGCDAGAPAPLDLELRL